VLTRPDTIITAFPERWCAGPNSLLDQILLHPTTSSLQDALFRIVRECVGFVDEPCNAGLDDNWYSIFEQSIADQANKETVCYKKFEDMLEMHRAGEKIEETTWDVLEEMAELRIIKDIRDELHMIKRVISEQQDVVQDLYSGKHDMQKTLNMSKISKMDGDQLLDSVQLRLDKVDKLEREALMVEQRVSQSTCSEPSNGDSSMISWISSRSRAISRKHATQSDWRTRLSSERSRASSSRKCSSSSLSLLSYS
jgi:hypothetical protein